MLAFCGAIIAKFVSKVITYAISAIRDRMINGVTQAATIDDILAQLEIIIADYSRVACKQSNIHTDTV